MACVQILLPENEYASHLQRLLGRESDCECKRVARPEWDVGGPIVADRAAVERFPELLEHPDRLVPVATKDPAYQARLWEHGIRYVVFDTDPPSTAVLAILSAALRERSQSSAKADPPRAPKHA
jgi:hypothetical protein